MRMGLRHNKTYNRVKMREFCTRGDLERLFVLPY